MTQENKELLLRDLCARLPYNVCGEGEYEEEPDYEHPFGRLERSVGHIDGFDHVGFDDGEIYVTIEGIPCELSTVKPYLRPMSSMTDDERTEFRALGGVMSYSPQHDTWAISSFSPEAYDWLNKKGFDYRGLIPMRLALESPEGMYKED